MNKFIKSLNSKIENIKLAGLYKNERVLESSQNTSIIVKGNAALNFCANNYLGLSNHPKLIKAAQEGLDKWGRPNERRQDTYWN